MEDKDNGTDALFDFASAATDNDYCVGEFVLFMEPKEQVLILQDFSSSTKTEAHIDGLYGYAIRVLDQ